MALHHAEPQGVPPVTDPVAAHVDHLKDVVARISHSAKHNAPIAPGHIDELCAIHNGINTALGRPVPQIAHSSA